MKEQQKQVIYSGILGDGSLRKHRLTFNSVHKEYMEFKFSILKNYCGTEVKGRNNLGYKKDSMIYEFSTLSIDINKELSRVDYIKESIENLNEFGIALLMYDDGSRHKKYNFYNINTHALSDYHQGLLIKKLNKFEIFPEIYTETKKDGRCFSYLYVQKWRGAMELSKMMRKVDLECYKYKLIPKILEDKYFEIKDTDFWKSLTVRRKTNHIKKLLGIDYSKLICENI